MFSGLMLNFEHDGKLELIFTVAGAAQKYNVWQMFPNVLLVLLVICQRGL